MANQQMGINPIEGLLQDPEASVYRKKRSPREVLKAILLMLSYDLVIWFFNMVIHTFFREIRSRGTFNIPKKGAVIFVIAPHHNQFVDPVVVMSTTRATAGRRISLLTAGKSYRRAFIGSAARLCSAIPVERAQDLLKTASGTIRIEDFGPGNDNVNVIGEGTLFTKEAEAKGLLGLPNSMGNAQIARVISDTEIVLRNPFKVNFEKPSERDKVIIDMLTNGTPYKTAPHVDNHQVFNSVFEHLNKGKAMGIFPEGGSHDRPGLLPLKPGVGIMALGAVLKSEDPNAVVNIIPVGLNYFHPHRFRSRVVVEYGKPIRVTKKDGEKYEQNSREVVNRLIDLITLRLKEVTVTCDDFDTLMVIQAARRLYTSVNREHIPLPLVVEMNRRLMKGYQKYSNREDVKQLKENVYHYNKTLMAMSLHDHQVEDLTELNRLIVFFRFAKRLSTVLFFLLLSLPGVFMFAPVFIVSRRISKKKAQEALAGSVVKIKANDVISTWKILVALGLAPMLYIFWAAIACWLLRSASEIARSIPLVLLFIAMYLWMVLTTYASLRTGESCVDTYKSLKPLLYSILSHKKDMIQIEELKKMRRKLAHEVTEFCERYGPSIFDDYDKFYREYNSFDENSSEFGDALPEEEAEPSTADQGSLYSRSESYWLDNLENIPIFSSVDESNTTVSEDDTASEISEVTEKEHDIERVEQKKEEDEEEAERQEAARLRLRKAMKQKANNW
ncbi:hypothetical protein ACI3LY_004864 [Candidozyma auris]|uniref:Phospholipid/glycerol acyltransferase domain-containing protein n=2 Tax=Candidozyma auris TaxID=498019 RepID=A0A8F2W4Q7_CANAR|nr:hypothetical protein QG37_06201 [[Candida] auris]QWW25728.1 hypothetical protein CA7LBN_004632 [[Candida] auris]